MFSVLNAVHQTWSSILLPPSSVPVSLVLFDWIATTVNFQLVMLSVGLVSTLVRPPKQANLSVGFLRTFRKEHSIIRYAEPSVQHQQWSLTYEISAPKDTHSHIRTCIHFPWIFLFFISSVSLTFVKGCLLHQMANFRHCRAPFLHNLSDIHFFFFFFFLYKIFNVQFLWLTSHRFLNHFTKLETRSWKERFQIPESQHYWNLKILN